MNFVLTSMIGIGSGAFIASVIWKMKVIELEEKNKALVDDIRNEEYWSRDKDETISDLKRQIYAYSNQYDKLFSRKNDLEKELNRQSRKIHELQNRPQQTIPSGDLVFKAIKKAMMDSHPDRGGDSNEFIEYNKIYQNMKKSRR